MFEQEKVATELVSVQPRKLVSTPPVRSRPKRTTEKPEASLKKLYEIQQKQLNANEEATPLEVLLDQASFPPTPTPQPPQESIIEKQRKVLHQQELQLEILRNADRSHRSQKQQTRESILLQDFTFKKLEPASEFPYSLERERKSVALESKTKLLSLNDGVNFDVETRPSTSPTRLGEFDSFPFFDDIKLSNDVKLSSDKSRHDPKSGLMQVFFNTVPMS